ncbi:hypothetical protein [Sphingomonas koreensis]|jgi:hypothetical protein|uniref:hypothetical protein n=1 Tax=Sphingomonas koreensis TaxID=93064 RepID=UPI00234EB5BA|nr:hypothetical protein [Sphingomonas koreensis]MDC7810527.1 hypothetical protein [Sphingomonas koreensis]
MDITIIRIDPDNQAIAKMRMRCGRNAVPEVRRILRAGRAQKIGSHELVNIEEKRLFRKEPHPKLIGVSVDVDAGPTPLVAAGVLNADEAIAKWHLKGCEDHAGIGLLFGKGIGGGMVDVPVNVAWVRSRIVWLPGESLEGLQERAEALLPSLPEEVTSALRTASGDADDGYWLPADAEEIYPAFIRLGLGDEATKGQRLTRLGTAAREMAVA